MTPDYEYNEKCHIRFFNCDNMDFMKEVDDKKYAISLVDPPYGIGEDGSKNHTRGKLAKSKNYKPYSGNDKEPPTIEYFNELFRISKNQIIWGANHFVERINKNSSCWLVWYKDNGDSDFADCELAYTSFNSAVRYFKWRWAGMLQQDMKNKEERCHPNQKPIALYRWILQNYAKKGDKILDTHGGSMTLARACYEEGFDLDIMELDKEYFDTAVQKFKERVSQYNLF